jgi:protein-S-isoprenylcysteine O-methyltransferase Ste14
VPPAYLLAALAAMLLLHHWTPVVRFDTPLLRWIGSAVIASGVCLSAWGATAFRRAGTPVRPFLEATALVTGGPFRWTRNPMYLGMFAVLAGTWIALGSLAPVLVLPAFFLLIRNWFVRHEEAAMAGRFGGNYREYCRKVRRWL